MIYFIRLLQKSEGHVCIIHGINIWSRSWTGALANTNLMAKRLKGTIYAFGSELFHMPTVVFGTWKPEGFPLKCARPDKKKAIKFLLP